MVGGLSFKFALKNRRCAERGGGGGLKLSPDVVHNHKAKQAMHGLYHAWPYSESSENLVRMKQLSKLLLPLDEREFEPHFKKG